MCVFKKKVMQQLVPDQSAPPPAPVAVADELAIDPKKKRQSGTATTKSGRSSLVVQRSVGGVASGSGLGIGGS